MEKDNTLRNGTMRVPCDLGPGDFLELDDTGRPDRTLDLTVMEERRPASVVLSRENVARVRDALTQWLEETSA